MRTRNVVIAGVGGQGVILFATALANAALARDLDASISEIHGMAQRGGSVISQVRIGGRIYSPTIPEGGADVIVGLEPLEALRALPFSNERTSVILNTKAIVPTAALLKGQKYPELGEIIKVLERFCARVLAIDAFALARRCGSARAQNMVVLGALAGLGALPIPPEAFEKGIAASVPKRSLGLNLEAFRMGMEFASGSKGLDIAR
ncbi:MAG: indolepyruvate oxidoreductase subunit beta [Candidatus Bathyarchaeia archaeon]